MHAHENLYTEWKMCSQRSTSTPDLHWALRGMRAEDLLAVPSCSNPGRLSAPSIPEDAQVCSRHLQNRFWVLQGTTLWQLRALRLLASPSHISIRANNYVGSLLPVFACPKVCGGHINSRHAACIP